MNKYLKKKLYRLHKLSSTTVNESAGWKKWKHCTTCQMLDECLSMIKFLIKYEIYLENRWSWNSASEVRIVFLCVVSSDVCECVWMTYLCLCIVLCFALDSLFQTTAMHCDIHTAKHWIATQDAYSQCWRAENMLCSIKASVCVCVDLWTVVCWYTFLEGISSWINMVREVEWVKLTFSSLDNLSPQVSWFLLVLLKIQDQWFLVNNICSHFCPQYFPHLYSVLNI